MDVVKIVIEVIIILSALVFILKEIKRNTEKTLVTIGGAFTLLAAFTIVFSGAQALAYLGVFNYKPLYKPFDILSMLAFSYLLAAFIPWKSSKSTS